MFWFKPKKCVIAIDAETLLTPTEDAVYGNKRALFLHIFLLGKAMSWDGKVKTNARELAREMKCSENQICYSMKTLTNLGLIKIISRDRTEKGYFLWTVYKIYSSKAVFYKKV